MKCGTFSRAAKKAESRISEPTDAAYKSVELLLYGGFVPCLQLELLVNVNFGGASKALARSLQTMVKGMMVCPVSGGLVLG